MQVLSYAREHLADAVQVVFQYQGLEPIRVGRQHWTLEEDTEWQDAGTPPATSQWNQDVYERVFLMPASAQLWQKWNRSVCNPHVTHASFTVFCKLVRGGEARHDWCKQACFPLRRFSCLPPATMASKAQSSSLIVTLPIIVT